MKRRAITLVELLVVIGIIAVLVSLLLPALRQVRQITMQTTCASRMRVIGQAFSAYLADNEGYYPRTETSGATGRGAWVLYNFAGGDDINKCGLAPYIALHNDDLKNAYRCPAAFTDNQMGFQNGRAYQLTFTMNCWWVESPGSTTSTAYKVRKVQQVVNPSHKLLVYDENENADDDQFWYKTDRDSIAGRHGNKSYQVANINGSGSGKFERSMGNGLYFDGHVDLVDNDMCHSQFNNDPSVP